MKTLTHFHNFARQQLWGQDKEVLLPHTDKVTNQQKHIYPQETVRIREQIIKGVLVLGGTVCSGLAAFALFGKSVEELKPDPGIMEGRIGRSLLAVPEVKSTLAPVSVFPTTTMNTVISMFNLFFDPDGQSLTLDVVEEGKQNLPSWMVLNTLASLYPLGTYDTPGNAFSVYVVGNLAYVADETSGLQIIDVSNPSAPTLKGSYNTPGNAYGVYVVGNLAYVADGNSGLQIIDVSNPSSPTLKGTYNTPGLAQKVQVVGNLAYVADYNTGLQIIDVSNPNAPTLRGTYSNSYNINGLYVVGNLAYVANTYYGLKIIDVSNPSSPILKGTCDTPGTAYGVYVAGSLAYVADGTSGLQIIDVSNPSAPTLRGTYDTPNNAQSVHVVGNFAFIADGNGLQIIDVSNPSVPTLKNIYDSPGVAYDVHAVGNFAYVADFNSGLQIIEQRFALSGTPNQTQIGNYEIELIAKDPDQNQVSQSFLVRVEGPPVASGTIPNQLINVDTPFNYFIDQNAFSDPNDDIVFYSSKLANQNPLPSWLSFSSIGIFSGNPKSSDVGSYAIKVLAFDGIAPQQAETTFSLVVDHFPEVTIISNQAADIGEFYNYTVPKETFTDADVGDVLTYNATLSNGNPLPSWLSFNPPILSGTPNTTNTGSLSIQLSATDLAGAKAKTTFTLNVEHFPDLANPIPNQLAGIGQAFSFIIPSNTYSDLDGDPLTYKATKSDGAILPHWLGFNALTQEFQGTPFASDKGTLGLKVIAEDPKGGQAATTFNLNVVDSLGEAVARIGGGFVYTIPNDMINNPQGPITYTVTLRDGSPLPTWLILDPVNGIISGIPSSTAESEYTLLITASDGVQNPVLETLNLQVETNAAPQVVNFISNQVAQVNQNFRFIVPDHTFIDPNGDPLTLNALRANGRGLPKWLKFEAVTRALQGKPGRGDTGAFSDKIESLQICATDGDEKACSTFDLSVQGTSNEELTAAILGPLGSLAGLSLAWYKKRGLFVNPFNQDQYDKGTKIVAIGQPFTHKLEAEASKVILVQAYKGKRTLGGIPVPKSLNERGWCEWLKHDKAIHGGQLLPSWLKYNDRTNQLTSHVNPRQEDTGLYVVRAYGYGGVILEEIKLDVGGQDNKHTKMLEPLMQGTAQ